MQGIVKVELELDRNKTLDEGIFLAICGREILKGGDKITSPIRLELAIDKIKKVLKKLEETK